MNRRGFLASILAAGLAPAICKAQNLMPVFVRRESGLLLPAYEGAIITLYDVLGRTLATIPMHGGMGPAGMSGHAPIVQTGVFHRATVDIPGWGRHELNGLNFNTRSLIIGNTMNMNVNLGVMG